MRPSQGHGVAETVLGPSWLCMTLRGEQGHGR